MTQTALIVSAALLGAPLAGGLLTGLDRVLTARLQSRVGPPVIQPFYDVIKLLAKEQIAVNIWQAFCAYAYLSASIIAVVLFFLRTDLLLVLFTQAVGAVFLVVGALSSTSPYSQVGAHRELLQILSYEPLLVLVAVGIYLTTGSFRISAVFAHSTPLLFKLPLLFVALGYVLAIKLRKSPFDLSTSHHAHQEIVKGLLTDYSGSFLAFIEIGHWFDMVLLLGICSLFWATGWGGMVVLVAVAYLAQIVADNATARMNWRWMLGYVWAMGLGLCIVNLIWVYKG
ncbi:MAG: respiratory chain complex I subunit 1 family protein [Syntrophobacteraceae bacterium]